MLCLKRGKYILGGWWRSQSFECKNLVQSGANLIVAGNAIFKDGKDFYEKNIRALKVPRVKSDNFQNC